MCGHPSADKAELVICCTIALSRIAPPATSIPHIEHGFLLVIEHLVEKRFALSRCNAAGIAAGPAEGNLPQWCTSVEQALARV